MDQTYNNIQQTVTAWIMRKWNAYEMRTEYSVLRYKTVARTGGFAAYTNIHTKGGNPSFAHSIETRINNAVSCNPKKKADLLDSYLKYGCYISILQSENIREWQWLRCFALFKKSRPVLIQIPLHLIIQSRPLLLIRNYRIWGKFLPS